MSSWQICKTHERCVLWDLFSLLHNTHAIEDGIFNFGNNYFVNFDEAWKMCAGINTKKSTIYMEAARMAKATRS